jgi:hypothetical protein
VFLYYICDDLRNQREIFCFPQIAQIFADLYSFNLFDNQVIFKVFREFKNVVSGCFFINIILFHQRVNYFFNIPDPLICSQINAPVSFNV